MTTKHANVQTIANIIQSLEEEAKPTRFDIKQLLKEYVPLLTFVASIITVLGFAWSIYGEISELNSRLGNVEGKLEILLDDRKEMLKNYGDVPSTPSAQQR